MTRLPLDDLDVRILDILAKPRFKSARSITGTIRVGLAIVLRRSHNSIGFKLFHFASGLAYLDSPIRRETNEDAQAMSPFLHAAEWDD
jgi:hypothetical protein